MAIHPKQDLLRFRQLRHLPPIQHSLNRRHRHHSLALPVLPKQGIVTSLDIHDPHTSLVGRKQIDELTSDVAA